MRSAGLRRGLLRLIRSSHTVSDSPKRFEVLSNPFTGAIFVIGLGKQCLLPLGNLVPNLVANLVDRNTLITSLL